MGHINTHDLSEHEITSLLDDKTEWRAATALAKAKNSSSKHLTSDQIFDVLDKEFFLHVGVVCDRAALWHCKQGPDESVLDFGDQSETACDLGVLWRTWKVGSWVASNNGDRLLKSSIVHQLIHFNSLIAKDCASLKTMGAILDELIYCEYATGDVN